MAAILSHVLTWVFAVMLLTPELRGLVHVTCCFQTGTYVRIQPIIEIHGYENISSFPY